MASPFRLGNTGTMCSALGIDSSLVEFIDTRRNPGTAFLFARDD
jgi:hypothetical protein